MEIVSAIAIFTMKILVLTNDVINMSHIDDIILTWNVGMNRRLSHVTIITPTFDGSPITARVCIIIFQLKNFQITFEKKFMVSMIRLLEIYLTILLQ